MAYPDDSDPTEYDGTREEMDRAIRRLDVLEWLILSFAVLVALLGGAAVAFLLSVGTELPFRATWAVISILLLAVPGLFVFGRELRGNGKRRRAREGREDGPPDSERPERPPT